MYFNPTLNDEFADAKIDEARKAKDKGIEKALIDNYIIKIGGILFSKMSKPKAYWNLEWVKGKPLVFALLPSHNKKARFFPDYKIIEYLYGRWYKVIQKEDGSYEKRSGVQVEHTFGKKSYQI